MLLTPIMAASLPAFMAANLATKGKQIAKELAALSFSKIPSIWGSFSFKLQAVPKSKAFWKMNFILKTSSAAAATGARLRACSRHLVGVSKSA